MIHCFAIHPCFARDSWRRYAIGEHVFSLDDIEHGILRCNKKHPTSGLVAFGPGDARLPFVLPLPVDPRIHFALNCGAKSCPAIRAYDASSLLSELSPGIICNAAFFRYDDGNLHRGLMIAAQSFCAHHVRVDVRSGWIHDPASDRPWRLAGSDAKLILSKIFLWWECSVSVDWFCFWLCHHLFLFNIYIATFLPPPFIARYESDFIQAATPLGSGMIPFLIENTEGDTKQQLQALPAGCHLSLRCVRATFAGANCAFPHKWFLITCYP